ncbi:hypothetical protein AJ80_08385 [Polytolypa hystricis UAMH7299]|uniref:Uncharacterized protein n=1 Tax=Polytolypa hystricis (strain UAMH7299) TaxID=1447883 RepID=A0A2B7X8C7_POLH7|nr:hypothetical protein AJ80_08385 [Polytolypa hystricis UAMH7299]
MAGEGACSKTPLKYERGGNNENSTNVNLFSTEHQSSEQLPSTSHTATSNINGREAQGNTITTNNTHPENGPNDANAND